MFSFLLLLVAPEGDRTTGGGIKMTYNPMFSPGSRDPSAESVTSLISTSTGNSISPQSSMLSMIQQRPHSITSKSIPIINLKS